MAGFIDAMLVNDEAKDIFLSRRKAHGGIPIHKYSRVVYSPRTWGYYHFPLNQDSDGVRFE